MSDSSSSVENYNSINSFLRKKFGERVLKICVDGGFTCPNRDGKCGWGGCIFCGERGSGEHLKPIPIKSQVENYLLCYKSKRANKFIVYFQNFTNTYAPTNELKEKYDSALCSSKIVGIAIATRPDCIDENVAKLLASYQNDYFVFVELGLQTSSNETAKIINRGFETQTFTNAVALLKKYNIPVVTHIMIGLPGEGYEELRRTIDYINDLQIWGLKIHSTYVLKNTKLETMYNERKYQPLTLEEYISKACFCITHINPNIVIHRISGDAPKNLLVAPAWNAHKKLIINGINKKLKQDGLFQGKYYGK